jgi:hypothetical protein
MGALASSDDRAREETGRSTPALWCVKPTLENGDGSGHVDLRTCLAPRHFAGTKGVFRLTRGETFIEEHHVDAGRVRDGLGDAPDLPRALPLPAAHVQRQPHDEPDDPLFLNQLPKCSQHFLAVPAVEGRSGMGHHAQIVGNGHANAD